MQVPIRRASTPRIVPSAYGYALFRFKKGIPQRIAKEIFDKYGKWIQGEATVGKPLVDSSDGEASVEFRKTEIYRAIEDRLTPGKWLKTLREANNLSQAQLGTMLGTAKPVRAARISDWENDFRAISKPVAKSLAAMFHVSVDRFI
jgi:DNA-binding transcriptional regulator YiaG